MHSCRDNAATWENLESSIVTMNTLSLFGMSTTGADICGFGGDTTEELCARWIEVGAFSPFSRNHNSLGQLSQELYRWSSVTAAGINALSLRYRLLSHLYTLLYRASAEGTTVMNALWVHFPADPAALQAQGQYMWYNTILFSPVLKQGATSTRAYFPSGVWYSLFDESTVAGPQTVELDTPLTATNAHVRGGTVLPMQEYAMTTKAVKQSPYTLIVALNEVQEASGMLYLDDGISLPQDTVVTVIDYTCKQNQFHSHRRVKEYGVQTGLKQVEFWGVSGVTAGATCTASMQVTGGAIYAYAAQYCASTNKLVVTFQDPSLSVNADYTLTWKCV